METSVVIGPFVEFVLPILLTVISGIITIGLPVIIKRLADKYGLQIEQQKRDALQVTLTNAAGGLLQRLGDEAKTLKLDVKDARLADAINRVVKGAPDALKWAGLDEREIARRILEKIPQIESTQVR